MLKTLRTALAAAIVLAAAPAIQAKQGAPHTVKAAANFSDVSISWQAPQSAKQLKWHNDNDYDGSQGVSASPQWPCVIYVGADFTAAELAAVKGEKIEGVSYFEYRPVIKVTAIIYEDGRIVREADLDLKTPAYKANQWRSVKFAEPYTIGADKNLRVALRIEHGSNLDFTAIMDQSYDRRGDLYSYDGKTWYHNGRGSYLVTANLANDVDEEPASYNVYADGVKVNAEPVTSLAYELKGQPDGTHNYKVEAVYADNSAFASAEIPAKTIAASSYIPSVAYASSATDGVDGLISWTAPLLRAADGTLSWSNGKYGNAIGGTAASNTKVWIKNEFEGSDLITFSGASITAINGHFHEKVVTAVTVFVMKDGAIVYSEVMPAEKIAEIDADKWVKFPLAKPVAIEPGHKYAYGYYVLHNSKAHPISVDAGSAVGSKGNSFSTSSPSSSSFAASKPSWKTLASGNIPGNWLMSADITGGEVPAYTVKGYTVARDGVTVADNVTACELTDRVEKPGVYTYTITANSTDGKESMPSSVKATYTLPDEYKAPLIGESDFNEESGALTFSWSMDAELKHFGSAAYKVGFDEEMTMIYGTRFTKEELADYKGFTIRKMEFIIGDDLPGGFTVGIFDKSGKLITGEKIEAGEVTPVAMYSLNLTTPYTITADDDIYFGYQATLPAGSTPIVLDGGPLVAGGAMVNIGMGWLNLGTINSTYKNYNIVVGAIASEPSAPASAPGVPVLKVQPKAEKFNVYMNGKLAATTSDRTYTTTLSAYDNYTFTVSAMYPNGWESPQSAPLLIDYTIRQAAPAPYNLTGTASTLSWEAPDAAPVLTLADAGTTSYGVGMTGSGTRETFAVHKYTADELKDVAGHRISHIKFALYSTELESASVVIFKNLNIAYEQPVDVSSLITVSEGYNTVRLNAPFEISADDEILIGYHITYANGIKPMIYDAGPAIDNKGNLLSASASHTSWKSLKSLNKALDGNWRIIAVLEKPAAQGAFRAPASNIYAIYRDGQLFKADVAGESYDHGDALPAGGYTVRAVVDGKESADSNVFSVITSGISDATTTAAVTYDAATLTVTAPDGLQGRIYNAAGVEVASGTGSISAASLTPGAYIYAADGITVRFIR